MNKCLRFCFKVDESVKMAVDEYGNGAEAFACIKATGVKSYTLPSKEYKDMQEAYRKILAAQLECDANLLTPITLNEYLDETEEDGDE